MLEIGWREKGRIREISLVIQVRCQDGLIHGESSRGDERWWTEDSLEYTQLNIKLPAFADRSMPGR